MNHMAITWWASDTMYWLNLMGMEETYMSECVCVSEITSVRVFAGTYLEGLVYGREMANTLTYCSATKLAYRWGRRTKATKKNRIKNHLNKYFVDLCSFCGIKNDVTN